MTTAESNKNKSSASSPLAVVMIESGDLRLACGVFREPFAWLVMAVSVAGAALVLVALAVLGWWLFAAGGWFGPARVGRHAWAQCLSGGVGRLVGGGVWRGVGGWLPAGWDGPPWGKRLAGGIALLVWVAGAGFLLPVIITAVAGIFLESLADRIERRYYPELPRPRELPLAEQLRVAVRGLLRGIGWNLLALPLYLIPVVNVIAYAYVNARLLSREYFQVVALRHLPAAAARELYRRHHWQMIRGGLVLAGLFVLPIVQLVAPLLAPAWAVHRLWRRPDAVLRVAMAGNS